MNAFELFEAAFDSQIDKLEACIAAHPSVSDYVQMYAENAWSANGQSYFVEDAVADLIAEAYETAKTTETADAYFQATKHLRTLEIGEA